MKICLLEPSKSTAKTAARVQAVSVGLKRLGYDVVVRSCDAELLETLRLDAPDVVFNLAGLGGRENAALIPAVLEIAAVKYTGSGILTLGLGQNYSQLYPLLSSSGVRVPPFVVATTGRPLPAGLDFPLRLLCDGVPAGVLCSSAQDLQLAWETGRPGEKRVLQALLAGERESLFLLDGQPFPAAETHPGLTAAQKAYAVLEARGLVRFDFVQTEQPVLEGLDAAPDPLDARLLRAAERSHWGVEQVLQAVVQHSACDGDPLPAGGRP